ncbi:MAG: exonuclease domain-containing protein [Corynebacterium sp.]|uniref:exonuclease domain-containing protein n=1 Tax=Corynebacterium sp. TaxID=1720 RepID=UPI0026E10CD9|nr:exonuclease domain-containing protein [Corynebacterium sp.]MDO5669123.1 exonuclease domain-containing protein [Corynebacterium sp.]
MTLSSPVAVLDLETTGLRASDRVIEIGVVLLDAHLNPEATFQTLIQPDRDIANSHVHGISATDLVDAPRFGGIAAQLAALLDGRVLIAHNAPFDTRFLAAEFARLDVDLPAASAWSLCTRVLSKRLLPGAPEKLADCLTCAGLSNSRPHAALADAEATAELFRHLVHTHGADLGKAAALRVSCPDLPAQPPLTRERTDTAHWLERLSAGVPTTGVAEIDDYRKLLRGALLDHHLSTSEINQLLHQAGELGLGRAEVNDIHLDYLRQLAVEAWADGVVTAAERAHLHDMAVQLGVNPESVDELLAEPIYGEVEDYGLQPGDRVAFTGALTLGYETWEQRSRAAGLEVGGVTRTTKLVVAANPDSMSGKARKARDLGVPIVDETAFARMVRDLVLVDPPTDEDGTLAPEFSEVFPWIESLDLRPRGPEDIAQAWLERHRTVPMHELSPRLDPTEVPDSLPRTGSVVHRWLNLYPRPLDASAAQLSDVPGFGRLRVHRTVVAAVRSALESPAGDYLLATTEDIYLDDAAEDPGPPRTVETITEWLALTGALPQIPEEIPAPVLRARDTLAADRYWADPAGDAIRRVRGEVVRRIGTDPRDVDIYTHRIMGSRTLEELGTDHGITRERIRQLETQLKRRLVEPDDTLHLVLDALPQRYGALAPVVDLHRDLPALAEDGPAPGHTMLDVLAWLADAWEVRGDWFQRTGFDDDLAAALADFADDFGVVSLAAVAEHLGVDKQLLAARLAGEVTIHGEHLLTRTRSAQDRAAALLAIAGEPLGGPELVEHLGEANPRTLYNAMGADPRIIRVGRDRWALADWGMEEYSTLAEWIGQRVETGPVPLRRLLEEASTLGVAESSVRLYASSADFQTVDGMVSRAEEVQEIAADPDETPGLYRIDGDLHLLTTVTHDHLRGSGSGVPRGLAVALEVPVLGKKTLVSDLGDLAVSNGRSGAAITTIRRFLEAADISEGERIWLQFTADGRFDVQRATPRRAGSGLAEVLNLTGLDTWFAPSENALGRLNTAIGLDATAPRRRTVSRFRHRRQDDIADLITAL